MHQKYIEQMFKVFCVERCRVGKQMVEAHHEEKQGCSPLEANFWYFWLSFRFGLILLQAKGRTYITIKMMNHN